ncbi:calcium-binding protein [Roseicyclus mahoneyensis]|uniref:Hemolysin type calcium-binding protein n=1 Tax=Roseicyclus mahoneyensis TaxID=164332 RepID=A0A316GHN3_9RHOB|nr:calcium-binding protein [Roseicyclus mahoneyensis]PWK60070.1 hemolysin type calcium-binding protein [Roseicyclus mahoneyensis]
MELLLLFLPLALLGALGLGGDDDDDPAQAATPQGNGIVRGGSSDDETLTGTAGDDMIFAAGGPDFVSGGAGADFLFGEAGNDTLVGNAGDDVLLGGAGNDNLQGGAGRDLLLGGAGRDLLFGGAGDDLLIGGSDQDTLFGGDGDDILIGIEITPEAIADGIFAEFGAELRSQIEIRHGSATADRFDTRIAAAISSANVEQLAPGEIGSVPRPDILSGGEGNDTLIGDHGDVMIGGGTNTADLFVVVNRGEMAPVTIRDFEAADRIEIDPGNAIGTLSFTNLDEGTLILVGTEAVAVIEGIYDPTILIPRVTLSTAEPFL